MMSNEPATPKAGLWKPWKNITAVFPPFPQPLLLLTNQQPTKTTDDRLHKILDATGSLQLNDPFRRPEIAIRISGEPLSFEAIYVSA
jgi:hypothetical protein